MEQAAGNRCAMITSERCARRDCKDAESQGSGFRVGSGRTSRSGSRNLRSRSTGACCSRTSSKRRWKELDEAFYTVLEFGTGGRRGKMYPVGTNVLNERTIAESARGLADYVSSLKRRRDHRDRV